MNFEDCLEKRLLRKEKPDIEKAKLSLEIAEERIIDSQIAKDAELYSAVIVLAYAAMFHASRALLFKEGYVEKSHVCLIEFVKRFYVDKGIIEKKFIPILNNAREERHEVLYGLTKRETKEEAEYILREADEYLKKINLIVNNIKYKK